MIKRITVEWSPSAIWGDAEPSSDYGSKESQYALALNTALRKEYPDAEIQIIRGINDQIQVNGMTDHDEVPWINQIQEQVWTAWLDQQ